VSGDELVHPSSLVVLPTGHGRELQKRMRFGVWILGENSNTNGFALRAAL
jgi:hypothetical protein